MLTKRVIFTLVFSLVAFCILKIVLVYFNLESHPLKSRTKKNKLHLKQKNDTDMYLINNDGCYVPNLQQQPEQLVIFETKENPCYERTVFVEQISDYEIKFRIDYNRIKIEKDHFLDCTYQFAFQTTTNGQTQNTLSFTPPKPFNNGTIAKLEEEIITITCRILSSKNIKMTSSFDDAFLILKKKRIDDRKVQINENSVLVKENWNILIISIDNFSRKQAYRSIPKTLNYMKSYDWLDYRGYSKVLNDSFSNTMAILTGKAYASAQTICAHKIDSCRESLIWDTFREASYVTAFGEENLRSDTFFSHGGFSFPPTDHYASPFFLVGEYTSQNSVCTKNKPSVQHLIEYAQKFALAYRNDSFFGYFKINPGKNEFNSLASFIEQHFKDFFQNLYNSNVMDNTFVFILSNQGKASNESLETKESFYEERLPMFFMWVPYEYRETYANKYRNLEINQGRLTSPYDFHATLRDLMESTNRDVNVVTKEVCPLCQSFTEEIHQNRSCKQAFIDENWCICHG